MESKGLGVCHAEINKIQTLADGGIRLSLDLPENTDKELITALMERAMSAYSMVAVGFGEITDA